MSNKNINLNIGGRLNNNEKYGAQFTYNVNPSFGFKLNGFIKTSPIPKFDKNKKTKNPSELLGVRKDLTPKKMAEFAQTFKDAGATILGGCCETRPSHIKAFSQLK